MTYPFIEHAEVIQVIAEDLPEFSAPGEVLQAIAGDVDEEFMEWWLPHQLAWQQRAKIVAMRLLDEHPIPDDWTLGVFPGWFATWWFQTLEFPWSARLGEAVEAAEQWLQENQ